MARLQVKSSLVCYQNDSQIVKQRITSFFRFSSPCAQVCNKMGLSKGTILLRNGIVSTEIRRDMGSLSTHLGSGDYCAF